MSREARFSGVFCLMNRHTNQKCVAVELPDLQVFSKTSSPGIFVVMMDVSSHLVSKDCTLPFRSSNFQEIREIQGCPVRVADLEVVEYHPRDLSPCHEPGVALCSLLFEENSPSIVPVEDAHQTTSWLRVQCLEISNCCNRVGIKHVSKNRCLLNFTYPGHCSSWSVRHSSNVTAVSGPPDSQSAERRPCVELHLHHPLRQNVHQTKL